MQVPQTSSVQDMATRTYNQKKLNWYRSSQLPLRKVSMTALKNNQETSAVVPWSDNLTDTDHSRDLQYS